MDSISKNLYVKTAVKVILKQFRSFQYMLWGKKSRIFQLHLTDEEREGREVKILLSAAGQAGSA